MKKLLVPCFLLAASASAVAGQDDFAREGNAAQRAKKDPLEGQSPPALQAANWLNTPSGEALDLSKLKGQVIAIKFWGVW